MALLGKFFCRVRGLCLRLIIRSLAIRISLRESELIHLFGKFKVILVSIGLADCDLLGQHMHMMVVSSWLRWMGLLHSDLIVSDDSLFLQLLVYGSLIVRHHSIVILL